MNWADLTLVVTPPLCAVAAGLGAAQEQMGWFSWGFAVGGFAIGIGCGIIARGSGILLLFTGCKQSHSLITLVLLIAYIFVPMAVMGAAFAGTAWLSIWIAKHLL